MQPPQATLTHLKCCEPDSLHRYLIAIPVERNVISTIIDQLIGGFRTVILDKSGNQAGGESLCGVQERTNAAIPPP